MSEPNKIATNAPLAGSHIVVVAHQPLGAALLDVVRHVYGRVPSHVHAVDVPSDQTPQSVADQLRESYGNQAVLLLTDLPGATPHNGAALSSQVQPSWRLLSPVTVPVLLRAINYSQQTPAQLLDTLMPAL